MNPEDEFKMLNNRESRKISPCVGHNKETEMEEQKERLSSIKNRVFESGAQRDSNYNKPFIHNLKGYTRQRFGYHMTTGARKYGDSNWEKGMPTDQYLESIDRHLAAYMDGNRSEDHLSAIIFGIQGCMINEKNEGMPSNHYFKSINE
jgi:hypothetical protein